MDDVIQVIKDQIAKNPVLLYMKGTPSFPSAVSPPRWWKP